MGWGWDGEGRKEGREGCGVGEEYKVHCVAFGDTWLQCLSIMSYILL